MNHLPKQMVLFFSFSETNYLVAGAAAGAAAGVAAAAESVVAGAASGAGAGAASAAGASVVAGVSVAASLLELPHDATNRPIVRANTLSFTNFITFVFRWLCRFIRD
jgi:hypothetical protein